ncbi:hypothetical protein FPRO05_01208 [Fusarium proliferatum]|uniref:Uncharacterized protein n=1 Tax=Gibberella intermedia TaxID=948311 RepID=A0A365NPT2_GIBIN|nr:hypothetical protein FPRO05_01208 [Fusarium proliferatum]
MDPDDRDRHVAEPTSLTDVSVEAELASGFSQQVENNNNSNHLDNLDPSLLGSPDFDFSCLMDLDESIEATQEPEQLETDSMMLDAPAFEAPCLMDDLNMTQILTSNVFHGSDHPGTNLYLVHEAPQHQVYVPQFQVGPDSMTSMTSENYQFSTETPNTFENPSVEAFAHSVEMASIMPEAPQSSGFGDQRFIQINEPPTQVQVSFPQPSRPRRRGRLTREQAEGQALARENGVCIRCRRNEPSMNETLFTERLDEELATKALAFTRLAFQGLRAICFPDGRYQKPMSSMVRKAEAQLLRNFPADTAGSPCVLVGNDRLKWTRQVAVFCDDRCLDNPYEDDKVINTSRANGSSSTLGVFIKISWLLSRYVELQLFRYLQNAANNPSRDIYEQRNFTYSALYLLGHSFSTSSAKVLELDTSDKMFQNSIKDHLDRERRVRLALWIYASITVGQLPKEANFWENLPNELKAFRGGLPKKFRESFDGFNNSLHMNMKIELGSKERFLQQLHSGQQTQEPIEESAPPSDIVHDHILWQSMVDNTAQGIPEIYHLNSGESAAFGDKARDYEQIEAERLFLPTNQEHFKRVSENAFGTILALARLPIRSQQTLPIRGCQVLRPSFLRIQSELYRFMGRLSSSILPEGELFIHCGEHPFLLYGADDMHLARWQELENMMGGGVFLVGNTANQSAREASHAFLDIATVTDTGTDVQFLRLKRLLQKNGSWLRRICGQLNGLVQAMKQIGHALDDERRLRAFRIILRRKVREVFGSQEASCKPQSLHCQDPRGIFYLMLYKQCMQCLFGDSDGWRGMLYENFQSILVTAIEKMHDGDLALQGRRIMDRVICTLVKVNVQFHNSGIALAMGCSLLLSEDESPRLETADAMANELLDATKSFQGWMRDQLHCHPAWALGWR